MRDIATDGVAWSVYVSVCVCVSVDHVCEPCKNGWTERDAVWGLTHVSTIRNHVLQEMGVKSDESIRRREGWQVSDAAFRRNSLTIVIIVVVVVVVTKTTSTIIITEFCQLL